MISCTHWTMTVGRQQPTVGTVTTRRISLKALAPDVYQAMLALDRAAPRGLDQKLTALVRLRASQINGCGYCIDMHSTDARAAGETDQRIWLLNAWRECSDFYTEQERAALGLTEAVTLLSETRVPDDVYDLAAKAFGDEELAHLISLIVTINAWNRISVTTRMLPRPADST